MAIVGTATAEERPIITRNVVFSLQTWWHLRSMPASDVNGGDVRSLDGLRVVGTLNTVGIDLVEDEDVATLIDWYEEG